MQRRPFGPARTSVPIVGQGTWELEHAEREDAVAALRLGLDLGLSHIDTAEMYGAGKAEELVGEAIAGRRDEVFLTTKVLPDNASRRGTIEACERSLARLRTDHVDLYLLHWPSGHPLEETLAAFAELRVSGKAKATGLSNFDEEGLKQALRLAGPGDIACDQVLYHLGERHVEAELLPLCQDASVALVAYSPFGSGNFPAPSSRGGRALAKVAREHGATPRQVALAFFCAGREHSRYPRQRPARMSRRTPEPGASRSPPRPSRSWKRSFRSGGARRFPCFEGRGPSRRGARHAGSDRGTGSAAGRPAVSEPPCPPSRRPCPPPCPPSGGPCGPSSSPCALRGSPCAAGRERARWDRAWWATAQGPQRRRERESRAGAAVS